MNTQKLSNVKLSDFREFLTKVGCKYIKTVMKNGLEAT